MIAAFSKRIIKKSLNSLGLEVRRLGFSSADGKFPRMSIQGLLQQAKSVGLSPTTVIDVGAAYGSFSLECCSVFPEAQYVLVEALEEFEPFIKAAIKSIAKAEYLLSAAAAESGEITMNVHADLVGSSIYREQEGFAVDGIPRAVPAVTLDQLIQDYQLRAPFLIKIDVQGAELDVLRRAEKILEDTEYIILEVSFFEILKQGAKFYDVVTFMKSKGFVVYDVCGLQYRPLDNALSQADIAFVRDEGLFRNYHYYANPEQRRQQNQKFELQRKQLSKKYGLK
jgi:FkbM family methyltransferase